MTIDRQTNRHEGERGREREREGERGRLKDKLTDRKGNQIFSFSGFHYQTFTDRLAG